MSHLINHHSHQDQFDQELLHEQQQQEANNNTNNTNPNDHYSSNKLINNNNSNIIGTTTTATKAWDVFLTSPNTDEDETAESKSIERILKFLKLIAYVITHLVVLVGASLSKGLLLLMASMIRPRKVVQICNHGVPGLERDKHYQTSFANDDPERISWIWAIYFILIAPEIFTLCRSARICTFKSYRRPTRSAFLTVILFESLHTIGIVILVFVCLPSIDVVRGAMLTSCICFLPATFGILSRNRKSDQRQWALKLSADTLALLSQLSALIIWPYKHYQDTYNSFASSKIKNQHELESLLFPVALLLVSCGWWENYVNRHSSVNFIKRLAHIKESLNRTRYFTYIFVSIWKIALMFATMLTVRYMIDGQVKPLFSNFKLAFNQHQILITKTKQANPDISPSSFTSSTSNGGTGNSSSSFTTNVVGIDDEPIYLNSQPHVVLWAIFIQILASWLCYVFGKWACRICIQRFSFAFALNLTIPITLSILIAACGLHFEDRCNSNGWLPTYVFWTCHKIPFMANQHAGPIVAAAPAVAGPDLGVNLMSSFANIHAFMWLIWLISQAWITVHIWMPRCERLATTDKLFVNPFYCGAIIDQSLALSRRRDEEAEIKSKDINLNAHHSTDNNSSSNLSRSTNNQLMNGLSSMSMSNNNNNNNNTDPSQHYETISEHLSSSGGLADPNGPTGAGGKGTKQSSGNQNNGGNALSCIQSTDHITRIYACVTMWHETVEEMTQMLKSVIRMDEDQSARRNAQKYLRIIDPDYYEFEVHIYFDDAFELSDDDDELMQVNRFVKQLVEAINVAASNVHQCHIQLKPPKKYPTPYGGRLEWIMPGQNKLIAHLKDKMKIRHRKRWSQVMYMYYLLGHRLMELSIETERKAVMAENTYILTLDGDINFRPHAVQLLVDLMKKNRNLGAACGRIHPVGSGPMVWYQKFEYAIGHWLHKSTEHMFGCVLCSPGCFSLFRAKALMDDNVMARYTTRSEQASDYVQYDQGEDRWLCTLLLQRGYRVEYSAASDAYTHCPEGFGEFYTQRRRWAPSTLANIVDLLKNYRKTVDINDSISVPYIIYQGMLIVGTILGPGTIFLMLVGAMNAVFHISNWDSFAINLIPIMLYIIICFTCESDIQILVAQIMSAAYALLMMAVFVGTAIQMIEDSVLSPTNVFFLSLLLSFFIAALAHPQEFSCFYPIVLYLLCVPSMYLLLMIYSLINLNVVTWGTREVQTKKTKAEIEEEKRQEEEAKKKGTNGGLMGMLNRKDGDDMDGSITFNLANLVRCMFCTYPRPNKEEIHLVHIEESLSKMNNKMESLVGMLTRGVQKVANRRNGPIRYQPLSMHQAADEDERLFDANEAMDNHHLAGPYSANNQQRVYNNNNNQQIVSRQQQLAAMNEDMNHDDDDDDVGSIAANRELTQHRKIQRDDLINPFWIEDKDLKDGEIVSLPENETIFWKELIDKYLHPLDSNRDHQARVANELKELRNRSVFAFFMVNALFILAVFLLQLHKDIIHVEWPFGAKVNATINPDTGEVTVKEEKLEMEPIGLVFVFFFAFILIIQFAGMILHRFGTLSHILASVELTPFSTKSDEDINDDEFIEKNGVRIARDLQRLRGIDEDDKSDDSKYGICGDGAMVANRNIVTRLEKRFKHSRHIGTLDVAFKKRFQNLKNQVDPNANHLDSSRGLTTPILGGRRKRETATAIVRRGFGGGAMGGLGMMGPRGAGLCDNMRLDGIIIGPNSSQMLGGMMTNSSGGGGNNRRMQTLGRGNPMVDRGNRTRSTLDRGGRPMNGASNIGGGVQQSQQNNSGGHINDGFKLDGSYIMMNHMSTMQSNHTNGGGGIVNQSTSQNAGNGHASGGMMMTNENSNNSANASGQPGSADSTQSPYLRNIMSENL